MKLNAVPLAMSVLMLCGSAALADTAQSTTVTTTETSIPAAPAVAPVYLGSSTVPIVENTTVVHDTAYVERSGHFVNRTEKNYANDSGNGNQMSPTIGVDYGVGRSFFGPAGSESVQTMGPLGLVRFDGYLREHTVGFPPHKNRWLIYDNNTSVALPMCR